MSLGTSEMLRARFRFGPDLLSLVRRLDLESGNTGWEDGDGHPEIPWHLYRFIPPLIAFTWLGMSLPTLLCALQLATERKPMDVVRSCSRVIRRLGSHMARQPAPPARHAFPTSSRPPLAGRLAEISLALVNIRSKLRRFGQVAATTTSAIAQEPTVDELCIVPCSDID